VLRGKAVRATRRDALGKTGMIADASFAAHGGAGGNPEYIPWEAVRSRTSTAIGHALQGNSRCRGN